MSLSDDDKRGVIYGLLLLDEGAGVLRIAHEKFLEAKQTDWPRWYEANHDQVDYLFASQSSSNAVPPLTEADAFKLHGIMQCLDHSEEMGKCLQKYLKAMTKLCEDDFTAFDDDDFEDHYDRLIETLMKILKTWTSKSSMKRADCEEYRSRLTKFAEQPLEDVSEVQLQRFNDLRKAVKTQMEQMANGNESSGRNDVNVKRIGVKVGKEDNSKFYIEGDLKDETTRNLIALEKGMGGGSVNVTMTGGSVEHTRTSKVTVINK